LALAPGTRLGVYEITAQIGEGGMGQVYRATDTKLKRQVAIKILPPLLAADPDRLARFQREAEVLASLNHSNVAAIYGLEDAGGVKALVLEMVEGPTLADRIAAGPIPFDEALPMARQLAEALEAAHEQGIVHRDFKPANIKLRPDGTVKVLDFGLAKATEPIGTVANASQSPTITTPAMTAAGVILGTAAYMSPEQARGKPVDKRADIWAFGCVLFETLTGRRAFAAETSTDAIAAILERDPDWTLLPATTPASIRRLLQRCLEKDPKRRLRDVGDARFEIEEILAGPATTVAGGASRTRPGKWLWAVGAITMAVLVGLTGWFLAGRSASRASTGVVRLSIPFLERPRTLPFGTRHLAISEDGSRIAYASSNRLWLRRTDRDEATAVADFSSNPFFSPDGEWVGFFSEQALMKVPVDGGAPVLIAMTTDRPAGATWRADGEIVFATTEGLYQVSDAGGQSRLLAGPDRERRERLYAWPQFLPDGRSLLFTIRSEDSAGTQIALLDLNTLEHKVALAGGSSARYVPTGHLVYLSGSALKAIRFDPHAGQVSGEAVTLPTIEIATAADNGAANFAISATGTFVFTPAKEAVAVSGDPRVNLRTLQWVDRQGNRDSLAIAPGRYGYPRVSPDGTRVALDINAGGNRDIWILNLERLSLTQLTSGPTEDMLPEWSPDGSRVFFASDRTGNFDVYSQAADGATGARVEFAAPGFHTPQSFTPDGTRLIVFEFYRDLGLVTLGQPDRLEPLLHGEAVEAVPDVSPDGHWIAYESDESGKQFEIFLRPFPNVSGGREKVSVNGGRFPVWARKGNEIYYVNLNGEMMAASVTLSPSLKLGAVTKLFAFQKPPAGRSGVPYDISPLDGRFIVTQPVAAATDGPTHISVVLNWSEELKALVPTK
jgi:serine/threonine-protein kinase